MLLYAVLPMVGDGHDYDIARALRTIAKEFGVNPIAVSHELRWLAAALAPTFSISAVTLVPSRLSTALVSCWTKAVHAQA